MQETHLNNSELNKLSYQWIYGSIQSPAINNSGGVAILYNKTFFDEIIEAKTYPNGRICSLLAKREDELFFFINIYAPNNNVEMLSFLEEVEEARWETNDRHPNALIITSGDFNLVLNPELDSINRVQTNSELAAITYLKEIMIRFNIVTVIVV